MRRAHSLCFSLALLFFHVVPSITQGADGLLTADEYIKEVRGQNQEVVGALTAAQAGKDRAEEADLLTSPALFAEVDYSGDAALPLIGFFSYDQIATQRFTMGFKKTTSFGMEAKVYYLLRHTNYVGMQGFPPINWYDARPTVELSQSLWANGFGKATRARQEAAQASALASSYAQSHRAKMLLSGAQEAYWRLALARERVEVASQALEQAQKIQKWSQDRVRRNLADEVDSLQAKAALEVRQLEMQGAKDEERSASRLFNRMRNIVSDEVPQKLQDLKTEDLLARNPASKAIQRDDVKAAEQQQRAAIAAAASSIESTRPVLDVYGSFALNGRDPVFGAAMGSPFNSNKPAYGVGIKFMLPLDRGAASEASRGWRQEQVAAEMMYRQKQQDLIQDYQDLNRKIDELKNRLRLTQGLANAQHAKLKRERERHNTGQSTTFQVLMFEQDFAQSRLAEINAKAELVRALAQLDLYKEKL